MSIRFRLTLLYSTILALTLLIFGLSLYSIQAQDTLNSLERDLVMSSEKLAEALLRVDAAPRTMGTDPQTGAYSQTSPPPRPFDEFSGENAFRDLREREIVRVLDQNGNLVASPFGRAEDALPLSEDGLAALQDQQEWWQNETVSEEHMLIYSRPIVREGETVYIVQVARSLTERDRTLKSLATTLWGAGLLTILVAFGAGWTLSGLSLRPIDRITQTAQAIGDERDFSRRVSYTGPQDEVGRLANTFNQMLTRLQDAYQKVEHSLEMQRNFVADVSHELRTPLTTLRGNLGLLARTPPAPPEEQADILVDMVDESDRLIRLVHDLLLLARADTGRSLAQESLPVQPVLEEIIHQAQQLEPDRQISLVVSNDLLILGDRDAFKQVILILVDNALKHSDSEVQVAASRVSSRVEIRVQDHGAGIPPGKLERLFDRFYRGQEAPLTPGFGLGLPIAKALVEGMGGTIKVESEVAVGSTIRLSFRSAAGLVAQG